MERTDTSLLADIGGTWSRFATLDGRVGDDDEIALMNPARYRGDDHPDLESVIRAYIDSLPGQRVNSACISIAGPVDSDRVSMPNRGWSMSIRELREHFGFERLALINDAAAGALATTQLRTDRLHRIREGDPVPGALRINIVPGTGLGIGATIRIGSRWHPLPGEGGHIAMAPRSQEEFAVTRAIASRHGAAIPDNTLSGPGMLNLYQALAEVRGEPARDFTPAEMTDCALAGEDHLCRDALDLYCRLLGRLAGDLALVISAHGGIYLTGNLVQRLGAQRIAEPFNSGFVDKGAMSGKVSAIPVYLVQLESPGLYGAAVWLRQLHQSESG